MKNTQNHYGLFCKETFLMKRSIVSLCSEKTHFSKRAKTHRNKTVIDLSPHHEGSSEVQTGDPARDGADGAGSPAASLAIAPPWREGGGA